MEDVYKECAIILKSYLCLTIPYVFRPISLEIRDRKDLWESTSSLALLVYVPILSKIQFGKLSHNGL